MFIVNERHSTKSVGKDAVITRVCETVEGVTGRCIRYGDFQPLNEERVLGC